MSDTKRHSKRDLKAGSKALSWLLRHGANETALPMDDAGFAPISAVLRHTRLSRQDLDDVVADNNKSRFEVRGDLIRAVQGHSTDGTPVTLDGLERSWIEVHSNDPLFHGTSVEAARSILEGQGVHAAARTHVHLAPAVDARVGKRAAVDVLLSVDPQRLRAAGLHIFRAPNGVLLAREVPRSAVTDVVAASRAGSSALSDLRSLLSSLG